MLKKLLAVLLALVLIITLAPAGAAGVPAAGANNSFAGLDSEREAMLAAMVHPVSRSSKRAETAVVRGDTPLPGYIVKFKSDVPFNVIAGLLEPFDARMIGSSALRTFAFYSQRSAASLEAGFSGACEYLEPDGKSRIQAVPSDDYFGEQWALRTTNVVGAWTTTKGSPEVLVAVLDSGIKRNHEDLAGSDIRPGRDFLQKTDVQRDTCGHGTNVTGLIAAATDNATGIAGVCWNVAVMPMLIVGEDGYADTSDICDAIYAAADAGADVINMSVGSEYSDQAESDAVAYAVAKGCIVVASAGNDGDERYNYPASYPGVISAAAVDEASQPAAFSNCNDAVDVAAPGVEVLTTADKYFDHQNYIYADGTSFSSPIVAGIAALAKSCNANLNAYMFLDLIKNTSTDMGAPGFDEHYGYGLINAGRLLERLRTYKTYGGYTYTVSGSTAKIIGYAGQAEDLIVPATLGGYTVASIGEYAFAGNSILETLTLPDSLRDVGERAFYMCLDLVAAKLGTGLSGFNENVFDGCANLSAVSVAAGNTSFSASGGILYNRAKTRLILCPEGKTGTLTVSPGVTVVGDYAFEACDELADVVFPQGLREIGTGAFLQCGELMELNLPGSVVKIGYDAFDGTGWYSYQNSGMVYAGKVAYAYKGTMPPSTRIALRTGTTGVAAAAFYDCASLTGVTIPPSVVCIGEWAFENCYNLVSAAIPKSVTEIGEYAFGYEYDESEDRLLDGFMMYCSAGSAALKYARDNAIDCSVPSTPGSPKAVSAGYNSAAITWAKPAGTTGALIYRCASPAGSYTRVGASASGTFTDHNLTCGKTYYYKVIAYTTVDTIHTYSASTAAVSAKPVPSVPANFKAVRSSPTAIRLSWSPVAGASGYVLYRYNAARAAYERLKVTTQTGFTQTGLATGRTYFYKVRAYKTVNGANVYGNPSTAVSANTY